MALWGFPKRHRFIEQKGEAMADTSMQTSLDDEEREPKSGPEKKRGNGWFVIVGLLVMILTPVASYFAVRVALAPSSPKPVASAPQGNPVVMRVDPLVVNIAGTRMTRVLRLQVHLVLSEARLEEILRELMPMVKDRIMTTAGLRTLEDLEGLDGRDALKRDIVLEINSMIRDRMAGSVLDVAFSEFLIQ